MKYVYSLDGSKEIVRDYPISGAAADVVEGAAIMRGATPGTDGGLAIVATGALVDILGVLVELHDYSVTGDAVIGGTAYIKRKAIVNPMAVYRAQYDTADDADVASTSGTTVTITSLEDDIDGGWLLGDDGSGAYGTGSTGSLLQYLAASASGSATSKTASGWTSANDVIKILPLFHQLVKINTAADKLGTDAAAGSGRAAIIDNWITADGLPLQQLDPTKHSGLTLFNPRVYSDIRFLNHAFLTID